MGRSTSKTFRRGCRLVAVGFLGAAVVAPSLAQAAPFPASVTLTGTYTLVHVDGRAGHPEADAYHEEFRAAGRSYDVKLPQGMAFRSGDQVTMTGRLNGTTLSAQHSQITQFAADVPAVGGVTKVLVVLADWTAPDSQSPSSAAAVFAADSSWFQQTSYGHLSLNTTVTPWVHVAAPAANLCSDSSVADSLSSRAVAASGFNANSFDRVVVYFPSSTDASCSNVAGFAEAPGSRVWLNGVMDARSTIHEQGHNYGLYHAHSAMCTTPGTTTPTAGPDAAADNCSYSDYGDPFDAMGASSYVGEYSASQKNVLGWLDAGRKATLTAATPVALVPYEQQSSAVHATSYAVSATRTYWFENRQATGPDASLPTGATNGVLVHVDDSTVDTKAGEASPWAPTQTYLTDQSPSDKWFGTSVLPYGQSWTSPEGVTFTVGQPSGGSVTVSVGVGPVAAGAAGSTSASAAGPVPVASGPAPVASFLTTRFASGLPSTTVSQGEAVPVSGTALRADNTGATGLDVELQSSPHGRNTWTTFGAKAVTGPGFVAGAFRPVGSSDFRLHVAASATEAGSNSNVLTVIVRPVVTAAVSKATIKHGGTVGLNVSIPGHAGQTVVVERWSNNAWKPYTTVRLGTNGRRSVVVRPLAKGHYRYRFSKPADAFHLGAVSKALQVHAL
jgi:hypothetical protein